MGIRIRRARHDAGYGTAAEFAEALGVDVGTVYSWEQPKKGKQPHRRTLEKIANLTGRSIAYFITGEEEMPQEKLTAALERTERELQSLRAQLTGGNEMGTQDQPRQHHPAVEEIAADAAYRARWSITDEELEWLRGTVTQPAPLDTREAVLQLLTVLRAIARG